MSRGKKITPEEKEVLIETTAKLKAEHPDITVRQVAKITGRSRATSGRIMSKSGVENWSEERFQKYRDMYKKKIDAQRMSIIDMADEQLLEVVKSKKIKPYQLIGLSKVFHEQTYPQNNPLFGGNNSTVNVQVIRHGVSHNTEKNDKKTDQAQTDVA